jgi:hypothetical protein
MVLQLRKQGIRKRAQQNRGHTYLYRGRSLNLKIYQNTLCLLD